MASFNIPGFRIGGPLSRSAASPAVTPVAKPSFVPNEELSRRLLVAHAVALGVEPDKVPETEVKIGAQIDRRVTPDVLKRLTAYSVAAQTEFFAGIDKKRREGGGLKVLVAPTSRGYDTYVDAQGLGELVQAIIDENKRSDLVSLLQAGPPVGYTYWPKPQSNVELIAGVLSHAALTGGVKLRLRVEREELRGWMKGVLSRNGTPRGSLGCHGAVATKIFRLLGDQPTMFALGSVPDTVLPHLPPDTRVVSDDPTKNLLSELPVERNTAGHLTVSFKKTPLALPGGLGEIVVKGAESPLAAIDTIETYVVGAKTVRGFPLEVSRMREIGLAHDYMLLSGVQFLGGTEDTDDYCLKVCAVHEQNTPVVLLYSDTASREKESSVWAAIKKMRIMEFVDMNAQEAFNILSGIDAQGKGDNPLQLTEEQVRKINKILLIGQNRKVEHWRSGVQSPEWVFRSAEALHDILGIPLVRVRGDDADVHIIARGMGIRDYEHIVKGMIASRTMATLKVACRDGIPGSDQDLAVVANCVSGKAAAGLFIIEDEILRFEAERGASPLANNTRISQVFHTKLSDGRVVVCSAPSDFYVRASGTVSAGDLITTTFLSQCPELLRAAYKLNYPLRD